MDRIEYPPSIVGHFRADQIAQRTTWTHVPDRETTMAALHVIHIVPAHASTSTLVNAMDPGTIGAGSDGYGGWIERAGHVPPDVGGTTARRDR